MRTGILLRHALGTLVSCALALLCWLLTPAASVFAGTDMVTDCRDTGPNTLRGTIASASPGDTIVFGQDCTITLTTGTLTLSKNVTIDATGHTVIVDGNSAVGVFATTSGVTVTLNTLTIQHGSATGAGGGGIYNNGGTLTVINCTVTANSAPYGGGIRNLGMLTVTNSTLSGNSASGSGEGGGILNNGTATLTNDTLTGNSASNGGGIYNYSGATLTLTNTIVASNTAGGGGLDDIQGTVTTPDHNLLSTIIGTTGISNGDAHGDIVTATPLLGPLSSNGGHTPTIPLLANSPAIGAGDAGAMGCASTGVSGVNEKDQRGFTRSAARCAIGSFEPQQGTYTVGSTSDSGATVTFAACQDVANATCKLRDALAYAAVSGDTVRFNGTGRGTITLSHGTLILGTSVNIVGPTGGGVTVDGGCSFSGTTCLPGGARVFTVNSGVTASLSNLTIQHGNASDGNSGGIFNNGGTVTVANSTVSANSGGMGGGIANSSGTLTVTNSILTANNASGSNSGGGGIYNGGTLTVTNSTLSGNSASGSGASGGGGIYNVSTATVTSSTLSGNSASLLGGGIANFGTVTVTNSTLSGNSAGQGGGIFNSGMLTATNSTLSGNSTGGSGGGINNNSAATLTNTIVAANSAARNGPDVEGAITSGGHNLIGKTDGSTGWIASDLTGTVAAPLNPVLDTLRANGGPTQTLALLPGSPAIDAGDDAVCAQMGVGKVNGVDQRGVTRPKGAHCDIGAFEFQVINASSPPHPSGMIGAHPNAQPGPHPSGPIGGTTPNPQPIRH